MKPLSFIIATAFLMLTSLIFFKASQASNTRSGFNSNKVDSSKNDWECNVQDSSRTVVPHFMRYSCAD
jgi:uncharacterized protein HemX